MDRLVFPSTGPSTSFVGWGGEDCTFRCVCFTLWEGKGDGKLWLPSLRTVLLGLVVTAQKYLDSWNDNVMGFTQREMSMKAYITFRVFLNRWSLKSKEKVGAGDNRGWVDGLKE